jgi:hypothetical protein
LGRGDDRDGYRLPTQQHRTPPAEGPLRAQVTAELPDTVGEFDQAGKVAPRLEEAGVVAVKLKITDNLPDLGDRVWQEEMFILLPVAALLSPAFLVDRTEETGLSEEEVSLREGTALRTRKHAKAS